MLECLNEAHFREVSLAFAAALTKLIDEHPVFVEIREFDEECSRVASVRDGLLKQSLNAWQVKVGETVKAFEAEAERVSYVTQDD